MLRLPTDAFKKQWLNICSLKMNNFVFMYKKKIICRSSVASNEDSKQSMVNNMELSSAGSSSPTKTSLWRYKRSREGDTFPCIKTPWSDCSTSFTCINSCGTFYPESTKTRYAPKSSWCRSEHPQQIAVCHQTTSPKDAIIWGMYVKGWF